MREYNKQKLIFLDIDGTIYSEMGVIPESAKNAIEKAKKKGHKIFVSTGRSRAGLYREILDLPIDGFICSGGAYIESEGEIIFNQHIKPEILKEIYQYLMENEIAFTVENNELIFGTGEQIEIQRSIYEGYKNKHREQYEENIDKSILDKAVINDSYDQFINTLTIVEDLHKVEGVNKIMFRRSRISIEQMTRDIGDLVSIYPGSLDNLFRGSGEFYHKDINKATGIQKILSHYGANQEDTIAFGDGLNDMEMIQFAGTGVAMGNAVEKLKQIADFVTKENINNGLYYGFVACGLI
jgi:Cof subfamily protein (haloacid dehalogenase superfamily)